MTETTASSQTASPKVTSRRKLRALARKKRTLKLRTDKEFAKGYFEARSKRSADKKTAYRKRHAKK